MIPPFAELCAASNFSFLRGASHPEELVRHAKKIGLSAFGLCDRNSFAGIVRAHMAAKEEGFRFLVGVRLCFCDGTPDIFVWPKNREAYGNLSQMLTHANLRAPKGECYLELSHLLRHCRQVLAAPLIPYFEDQAQTQRLIDILPSLTDCFGSNLRLALCRPYGSRDQYHMAKWRHLARQYGLPVIATNNVLYHDNARRSLQDILTCIRLGLNLDTAEGRLEINAERYLKDPQTMAMLFDNFPQALEETSRLVAEIDFSLDALAYEYPVEICPEDLTPQAYLAQLAWQGASGRYKGKIPKKVKGLLVHELTLVDTLCYAPYFLTIYDIVRFARSQDILCQGRGSAANSAICYCLGITEVDPARIDLLFERFISVERAEPPDIDVDFEHQRREEIIQYIYQKYGRAHAGLAATIITYRARSALREVGKAFALSQDIITRLIKTFWGWSAKFEGPSMLAEAGLDPHDKRLQSVLYHAQLLLGFPRHLSQHPGGFVITRSPLDCVAPIHNAAMEERTAIEWDKNDLEALGMLKIDILGLGMLSALNHALKLLNHHYQSDIDISQIPAEDDSVYDMICRADTIGVFQIESRAQMSMLPRLRPRKFYDLVIEVAIVRPGPIQGDMVHPYLRRRQGKEAVSWPSEELREVLGNTLGIPLFQEQAMKIAIIAAGFSPSEADKLRRAMATFRRVGTISFFQNKMVEGMVARGYEREFAESCFRQIEGFGEYGFPESHAASFAILVYASAWVKAHYPDVFLAALLNSQPLGFYAPSQLISDARAHGVKTHPVDINLSMGEAILEAGFSAAENISSHHRMMRGHIRTTHAVRLGLRMVKGLPEKIIEQIIACRGAGYDSVHDLWQRAGIDRAEIIRLAGADVFRSIGLDRRAALWAAQRLDSIKSRPKVKGSKGSKGSMPLFDRLDSSKLICEPKIILPAMPLNAHVIADYRALSLSLKGHPLAFLRKDLARSGMVSCCDLAKRPRGCQLAVAGLVLVRQRPGSAKGVIFMTLEDESGTANIIVWPKCFEIYRPVILAARFVAVHGRLQKQEGVIHIVAERLTDKTHLLAALADEPLIDERITHQSISDEAHPVCNPAGRQPSLMDQRSSRPDEILPSGRNFH